ncbi:glycosyltransferase family 2 protein [Dinoroseobacter sp. S375]|uniref:glycosyltransferase family 2 protein n=1 Tax=Dinoroseobacter sp. S375 TaxID=3415136 RepID=UPI003C7B129E
MKWVERYRLRLRRKRLLWRSFRRRRQLTPASDRTGQIARQDILAFVTLRNERIRLPFFLDYYRKQGVDHFLIVDNGSEDGSAAYLAAQKDVSLWTTPHSYRRARFGVDWLTWLQMKFGHGHWCLTVDVDEFLIYPFCETRPLAALTDWMDASGLRAFPAMLLDLYPKGPLDRAVYAEGQNPMELACWFDSGNYTITRNPELGNLWIQGGPRARAFFADRPEAAPALNKTPLIKWDRSYAYVDSTHMVLPRGLNNVYETGGGERISGCLLHTKFLDTFIEKSEEEIVRQEHYARGREYKAYAETLEASGPPSLWTEMSERYVSWRQLEILGLLSKGSWA